MNAPQRPQRPAPAAAPKAPPIPIRTVTQADWSTAKILLYGPAGVGKTRAAGGAPNPLILDIEGGVGALAGDVARVPDLRSLDLLIDYLAKGDHAYESIVLDGLGALYAAAYDAAQPEQAPRDRRLTHVEPSAELAGSLRRLLALPLLKVVTAHSRLEPVQVPRGTPAVPPRIVLALPPALREVVHGLFDVIAYCEMPQPGKRLLHAGLGAPAYTKDRTGLLGAKPLTLDWPSIAKPLGL